MDPLETMWVSDAALGKGTAAPPSAATPARPVVVRDPSLPCFPAPTEHAVTEQLRELQEGGAERACCLAASSLLPKDTTVMAQYPLPLGLVVSPFGADKSAFVHVRDQCPQCPDCGAVVTAFSSLNSGCHWICSFCDADVESLDRYSQMEPNWNEFPELHHAAIEWDEGPCDHLVGEGNDTVVILIDLSMARDDLAAVSRCVAEALKHMSQPTTRIALIGFDNAVQVFHLDSDTLSSSLCFPAIRPLNAAEQDMLTRPELRSRFLVPTNEAVQNGALQCALDTLGNLSLFRNNVGLAARERGLANALEVAAFLANPNQKPHNRTKVLFVLGGPPNLYHDPQAQRNLQAFWEHVSLKLSRFIHSVDGLFVAPVQCQIESFFPYLTRHVAGSPTAIPFAPKNACPDFERTFGASLTALLKPLSFCAVSFGVYAQGNVRVTHVIGPLVGASNKIHLLPASSGVVRGDALAVYFDQKLASGNVTLIQVVCSYIDLIQSKIIKRVVTVPLLHTRDLESWKSSISDAVTGALLAKRVAASVSEARRNNKTSQESVAQFRLAVDRTLTNAVRQFEDHVATRNLSSLPFVCYALRKSSVVVGGGDDQSFLQRLLLGRLNVADTLSLLVPKLVRVDRSQGMKLISMPPEELSLNPRYVIGMDTFTHLFLWSGEQVTAADSDVRDVVVDFLLSSSVDRLPQPVLYSFRQGDSGARFVTNQLVPSHVDRPEEIDAAFPEIAALSATERKKILLGFGMTDELSFRQYCRHVFAEAKRFAQGENQ